MMLSIAPCALLALPPVRFFFALTLRFKANTVIASHVDYEIIFVVALYLVVDKIEKTSYKFLDVLQGWKFKFASFAWTGRAYLHYTLYLDHHVTNKKNS
jgi:hypothetical protein